MSYFQAVEGGKTALSAFAELPSAQNNPYSKVAYFGVVYPKIWETWESIYRKFNNIEFRIYVNDVSDAKYIINIDPTHRLKVDELIQKVPVRKVSHFPSRDCQLDSQYNDLNQGFVINKHKFLEKT